MPNKGRLGSGVPHREPSVLHVIVEAVAGDLGASQVSSQLPGEGGGADEGKSSCLSLGSWGGGCFCRGSAMRQRKLGSHTPPCHRRMVITTIVHCLACCTAA